MKRRRPNALPEYRPEWRWVRVLAVDPTPGAIAPAWIGQVSPPPAQRGEPYFYDFSELLEGDISNVEVIGGTLPAGLRVEGLSIVGIPT